MSEPSGSGGRGVAIFLLLLGLGSIGAAFMLGRRVVAVSGWPTATATVIDREIGDPEGPTGGSRNARWVPKITYTFKVDGRSYQSKGRGLVQEAMTAEDARAWLDELPEHPTVHYNPDNPSEAYVETGSLVLAVVVASFGGLLLLGAVVRWNA